MLRPRTLLGTPPVMPMTWPLPPLPWAGVLQKKLTASIKKFEKGGLGFSGHLSLAEGRDLFPQV